MIEEIKGEALADGRLEGERPWGTKGVVSGLWWPKGTHSPWQALSSAENTHGRTPQTSPSSPCGSKASHPSHSTSWWGNPGILNTWKAGGKKFFWILGTRLHRLSLAPRFNNKMDRPLFDPKPGWGKVTVYCYPHKGSRFRVKMIPETSSVLPASPSQPVSFKLYGSWSP